MIKRILTSAIIIMIAVLMITFFDNVMLNFFVALLISISIYEVLSCFNYEETKLLLIPSVLFGIITAFLPLLNSNLIVLLAFAYISIAFIISIFVFAKIRFQHMITIVFYTLFISVSFMALSVLATLKYGNWYIALALGSAFCTDTFAFLSGSLFGRHKLCPYVSPKKSIEGAVGGFVFTVAGSFLFSYLFTRYTGAGINMQELVIVAGLLSIIAQIGDLAASMIKRTYKVKDFGFVFPGHGGVYDRFDSVLFTSPLVLIIVLFKTFVV